MFLKSVNNGFILYEYSVCLLHFYEPEGKLGNRVWLTKQRKKNTIKKIEMKHKFKRFCVQFSPIAIALLLKFLKKN